MIPTVSLPRVRLVHALPEIPEYQERPEVEKQLREFWRSDTLRIAALVGIGGAGKTALARHFPEELPGSAITSPKVAKRVDLPPPDGLFVWSFNSAPYVEEFFAAAFNFICSCAPAGVTMPKLKEPRCPTVFMVEEALRRVPLRFLFVIDGLEKMQSEGHEGEEVGLLTDFPLKQFLTRVAESCGGVKAIITSRYPLLDLKRYATPFKDEITGQEHQPSFQEVHVGDLDADAAVALLHSLGVRGSDAVLSTLADRFGRHAFAVSLAGRWVREFFEGDPEHLEKMPALRSVTRSLEHIAPKSSQHMEQILSAFTDRLSVEGTTLLELLSIFCTPVSAELLYDIVSSADDKLVGNLTSITQGKFLRALDQLCALNLVQRKCCSASEHDNLIPGELPPLVKRILDEHLPLPEYLVQGSEGYHVHRLIKEHFDGYPRTFYLHTLVVQAIGKRVDKCDLRAFDRKLSPLFKAVEGLGFHGRWLTLQRFFTPSRLNAFEELIYHLTRLAAVPDEKLTATALSDAWNIFYRALGGFEFLGKIAGEYSRGARVLSFFFDITGEYDPEEKEMPPDVLGSTPSLLPLLLNSRGLFCSNLGNLSSASTFFQQAAELRKASHLWLNASVHLQNLGESLVEKGRLVAAEKALNESLMFFSAVDRYSSAYKHHTDNTVNRVPEKSREFRALSLSYGYRAYIHLLRGQIELADDEFSLSIDYEEYAGIWVTGEIHMLASNRGHWLSLLYVLKGNLEWASNLNAQNRKMMAKQAFSRELLRCNLLDAEISLRSENSEKTRELLNQTLLAAKGMGDMPGLLWGNLILARLQLVKGALTEAHQVLQSGIWNTRECGYGLYWIDFQITRGQWELACGRRLREGKELSALFEAWTPQQWFERAEASTRRALNGQLKNSDEPALRPDLPEQELVMLGARHPECGYAWGEGDALHLLGEALLEQGRYEEAEQRLQDALALRQRIQDPKAKGTHDLLEKIQSPQGGIEG